MLFCWEGELCLSAIERQIKTLQSDSLTVMARTDHNSPQSLADHSMSDYWYNPVVCPSVRPSVCLRRCALWLSGLVYRTKSCTSVFLAGMFLFVHADTFAVGCIV